MNYHSTLLYFHFMLVVIQLLTFSVITCALLLRVNEIFQPLSYETGLEVIFETRF